MTAWDAGVRMVTAYLRAGGWLMLPLLLVAFLIWCAYLLTMVRLRAALRNRDVDTLLRRAGTLPPDGRIPVPEGLGGAVPRMTRCVVGDVGDGVPFRDACARCKDGETEEYRYSLLVLGALVTAAPLLGLLGTVLGMIDTFEGVAMGSEQTAGLVAGGISRALITTQVGLVAALPGTLGLAHVFRLFKSLENALDLCETRLGLIFEHGGERKP